MPLQLLHLYSRVIALLVLLMQGALLKETKHINKSLSVLSNVIERLQSGNTNVPFRESKLTFLLQNSLGGNSKTLAIVCCNPLQAHFHESLCSLRFAAKVNKVDLKAVANFSC
jgi:kinesin family protein C1